MKSHVTPLHVAATKDRPLLVRLLLAHGANIYARNNWSQSPCMLAKKQSQTLAILQHCQGMLTSSLTSGPQSECNELNNR